MLDIYFCVFWFGNYFWVFVFGIYFYVLHLLLCFLQMLPSTFGLIWFQPQFSRSKRRKQFSASPRMGRGTNKNFLFGRFLSRSSLIVAICCKRQAGDELTLQQGYSSYGARSDSNCEEIISGVTRAQNPPLSSILTLQFMTL